MLLFYVLVISYIWRNLGYDVVLWMAGLSAIPAALYEAAKVDGAKLFPEDSLHYSAKSSKHNRYLTFCSHLVVS